MVLTLAISRCNKKNRKKINPQIDFFANGRKYDQPRIISKLKISERCVPYHVIIMDTYNSLKNELLQINQNILSLFSAAESIPELNVQFFDDWKKICIETEKQLSDDIIKIAVVGTIKSGKSTFVNSLLKNDYLKRGAGVVTSIVTKIRKGRQLKANLYFKSWNEINTDMEQAMVLLPPLRERSINDGFDIRQEKDRIDLQQILGSLSRKHLIADNSRNVNSLLLTSYLKGYEAVKEIISEDSTTMQYDENLFAQHRSFVGDESLSVYLKDIELEIDSVRFDSNVELADCQGSDSPNPLHIAMIQDYLLLTHFIIYIVSSRTGLRQADIKFLSMIRKMGIMDNILFIINCDFSEHESIEDIKSLAERIKEELSLLKTDPEVHCFSALYNLFKSQKTRLPEKEKQRLLQWEKEAAFITFSDMGTSQFETSLNHKLTQRRYTLLLKNHLERFGVIASGISNWIQLNHGVLTKDAQDADKIIAKIKQHQQKIKKLTAVIKSTLDGGVRKIKHELRSDIDQFFNFKYGGLLNDVIQFIRNYKPPSSIYEKDLKASNFSGLMFMVFQEFKQALDSLMAENINPEVIRFMREEEKKVKAFLESNTDPYDLLVQDALAEYGNIVGDLGINLSYEMPEKIKMKDIDSIKRLTGLTLPPAVAAMRYSARIKSEATIFFGYYKFVGFIKRLFKTSTQNKKSERIYALNDGILRMKRETEKSVKFHFKDYKENIKFQYIFKLTDAISDNLYETFIERFQSCFTDLAKMAELVGKKQIDKETTTKLLEKMEQSSKQVNEKINKAREKIKPSV